MMKWKTAVVVGVAVVILCPFGLFPCSSCPTNFFVDTPFVLLGKGIVLSEAYNFSPYDNMVVQCDT